MDNGPNTLFGCVLGLSANQPAVLFSHTESVSATSYQLPASQQYHSLITNQHQPPVTAKRTLQLSIGLQFFSRETQAYGPDGQHIDLERKSSIYLPRLWAEFIFPPWTRKPGIMAPQTRDTGKMSSLSGFSQWFSSFSFMFILDKYLKIYSESQKHHKMENPILLDSA